MYPIQQGFSGHVPMLLKSKFPKAKILNQTGWNYFDDTAQLDPVDPLFFEFGTAYLNNLKELFGNCHYLACDPFHEGKPPKPWFWYLKSVGKAINHMYESFDKDSIWVMQSWSLRKHIAKAVPKNRLLILDINSEKALQLRNFWGYPVVSGMLHNFGGKNAMQGKLKRHCENKYLRLKAKGANVAGTGMFMEGIEQNPVIYDLQFELLTSSGKIECSKWLDNYIKRRYGKSSTALHDTWNILLQTCYKNDGYHENEVGSAVAARPQLMPVRSGPCCYTKLYYDKALFEKAVLKFISVSDDFCSSDGYQYDLCDLLRQALSNRFYTNQQQFEKAYTVKDIDEVRYISEKQLELLKDMDALLSHRSEFCLSRWIGDSHKLAADEAEKKYFDFNARTLITLWGNINKDNILFDYAWREWNGLVGEFYYGRWKIFYDEAISCLEGNKPLKILSTTGYSERKNYISTPLGKRIHEFEMNWIHDYKEYPYPEDKDVVPCAKALIQKWNIGE